MRLADLRSFMIVMSLLRLKRYAYKNVFNIHKKNTNPSEPKLFLYYILLKVCWIF